MSTTEAIVQTEQADYEARQELLEALTKAKVQVDENTSLAGLQELWLTFGPPGQLRAKIEEQRRNEEATPAKRELEAEPEKDDEDELETPATPKPDPEGKRLFDESDYERDDLAIAKIDGNQVDRIAVKFAGEVFLDRSDPADVALYNKLRLGSEVTLMIEGRVSGTGAKGATDREGDLDVIVGQKAVKVGTVYIPAIAEEAHDAN